VRDADSHHEYLDSLVLDFDDTGNENENEIGDDLGYDEERDLENFYQGPNRTEMGKENLGGVEPFRTLIA